MPSVFDVAAYILQETALHEPDGITTWKLQKLVYFSQAWSSVWDDEALFSETIEAWANGPVCPDLYDKHRGDFKITSLPAGNPDALTASQKDTINCVVRHYGQRSSQYLSELTHKEDPWIEARRDLSPGERGNNEITVDSMALYYGGLYSDEGTDETNAS